MAKTLTHPGDDLTTMTAEPELSELDQRVLRALWSNRTGGMYLAEVIAAALRIKTDAARSVLERLYAQGLVEDDDSGRQRYARTRSGDQALRSSR